MQIISTTIPDLKIIQLKKYHDERGFFVERYNQKIFADLNLPINYFQDNHSFSLAGVVRGLHYQSNPPQLKLVGCLRGKILDVAVDIRKNSPTFGKYFATELSHENCRLLLIPAGFAHGFSVIDNNGADVFYKVDSPYNQASEGGIIFDDPTLNIDWQVKSPIVSSKDKALPTFAQYSKNPIFF